MKARVFSHVLAALVLFALLFGLPGFAQAKPEGPCGPNVVQKGNVFTIRPNGVDDTAAIQCAIDAATATGKEAVVQLTDGTFLSSFITAYGFTGVFKGKGMDKTEIQALPDLRCDLVYAQNKYPTLIEFRSAKLRVTELSITFPDETPCVLPPEGNPFYQGNSLGIALGISANFKNSCDSAEVASTAVLVDSIAIRARPGEFGDPSYYSANLVHGVVFGSSFNKGVPDCPEVGARSGGSFKLARSHIDQVALPVFVVDLKDARVLIGGSPLLANKFENMGHVFLRSNFNTNGIVSFNQFNNVYWESITLLVDRPSDWQSVVDQPSTYLIDHNTFNLAGGSTGLWIEDQNMADGIPSGMRASITNNQIQFNGFYHWGVYAPYAENFLLAKNTFIGPAFLAAWIGEYGYEGTDPWITARRWMIVGNKFDQAVYEKAHYVLTNTSANNVVIGTGQEVVVDLGSDNILKNVILQSSQAEASRMGIQSVEPQSPTAPMKFPRTDWHARP
jgi:hypothetical protein